MGRARKAEKVKNKNKQTTKERRGVFRRGRERGAKGEGEGGVRREKTLPRAPHFSPIFFVSRRFLRHLVVKF